MAKVHQIFSSRYPLVSFKDMPGEYRVQPITFKSDEIDEHEVILFHRLMQRYYGNAQEIEPRILFEMPEGFEQVRPVGRLIRGNKYQYLVSSPAAYDKETLARYKKKVNEIMNRLKKNPFGGEWRYFIRTKSGGIIHVGTKDVHTKMLIGHVLPEYKQQQSKRVLKEGETFVNALLAEANRLKLELLNVRKEFEQRESLNIYTIHNVYLSNYTSAELMLESAHENEEKLMNESLRHDLRENLDDADEEYTKRAMHGIGMYYAASFAYYFMALEGFVNLVYHAFLKEEFRDKQFNLEGRLHDLELKLRLMSVLCKGFRTDLVKPKSKTYEKFVRLRKYRNMVFHSRIEDSLRTVLLFESGFFYPAEMKSKDKFILPLHRFDLKKDHILEAKGIVDSIIHDIVSKMKKTERNLVKRFILKDYLVSFHIDNGEIRLGLR
jgi:hypothetical protein